ncbi:hypothetical protein O3796_04770 [Granulicatella adiacens]|uniref:hypothetical protein n=1 Tax=Granulicatella adiacens TaxID=46124 RepID=UPI00352ED513
MNKKKRFEESQLARLRELLIAAIRERSGKVVALPSPSVMPIIFKNILKIFLIILTTFIFLFSLLKGFDFGLQALIANPFKFLKEQMEFNPFFRIYLFFFIVGVGLFLWERKEFKEDKALIVRRAKEEVLEWQNFTNEELPNSVKELKQDLSENDDAFNIEESREPVIKSLLRLFPRNVSQEDINELRQQLITILSERQQDVSKLPKGMPYLFVSLIRLLLLCGCLGVTLPIIWLFITSYYDAIIMLAFLGIPIGMLLGMLWISYFGLSSSVHEKRKIAFDKLFEIARAEVATYKDVAVENVPEEIKHLQSFIEVLESKYHLPGENSGWKKTES